MNYAFPQTNRQIAQKQLDYLGYTSNQVYLRFFYHSQDPRKDGDKGRKGDRLDWRAIERYQQDERGAYVVVNGAGGGHEDKDILQCAAIFCEWDDRPISDQLLHWETVGFFEPTFTVYSGDKSAQPYWVFDTPIEVEKWRELQRLLIAVMGADPINKNPSRVFRLAGGWHVKPGREPKPTEIVQESGQKYNYQQLKERLIDLAKPPITQSQSSPAYPQQVRENNPPQSSSAETYWGEYPPSKVFKIVERYEDISLPVPQTVPIEVCLSKDSRQLLESGCVQGGRNGNGAKLARDLIGTAAYLQAIGQSFEGDPKLLLETYALRCSPTLPTPEVESIWASAVKSNPAPSCTPDGVENCVRAWYWKNHVKNKFISQSGSSSNSKPSSGGKTLCDRIEHIFTSHETESAQTAALMDLAAEVKKSFNEIKNLARIIRAEGERANEVIEAIDSFTPIIKNCRQRLDLARYLHPILAESLIAKAAAMPTAPEYLFNTLLPASASRIGTSARIIVDPLSGYTQDCIFWTANVAHSGQAKTPPQKEIIAPLEQLEAESKTIYDALLADYEQDKKAEGKPPVRMRRLLSNVTTSTKIRIHEENKRGLLEYIDELVADYQRLNQYKGGGKGDDLQLELSFFNGAACNYDRHDARLFLSRTAFSKTGTYQWDTLARLMADDVNFISSGYSARFLYCSVLDAPPRYLDLLSPKLDSNLGEILTWLYGELEQLPERDYLLSHEAKILFQAWNHTLADDEREENHFAFSIVFPKIEAYTARIALWLHIVNAVASGTSPEPTISGETMQHAVEISSFYLWQQKLIHANNAPARKLEGIFFKVQTQAEKFFSKSGMGLGASYLKTRINALKGWTVEKIRTVVFTALAKAGHGRTEGEGSMMKYIPNTSSAPKLVGVGELLVKPPIVESSVPEGVQPEIGEIGGISHTKTIIPAIAETEITAATKEIAPEQNHQFTNSESEITAITSVEPIGATTNNPPIAPIDSNPYQNLAFLLLEAKTWVEIAQSLQKDTQKLTGAMRQISSEQRHKIASLLIDFLCSEPKRLVEITWLPKKMLNWVFERLTFAVHRIGGESIDSACMKKLENLSFVSVEKLGSSSECWVFSDPKSGVNIPIFDPEAICAISLKV